MFFFQLPEEETLNEEIENTKGLKVNFTNELLVVYEVGSELVSFLERDVWGKGKENKNKDCLNVLLNVLGVF